MRPHAVSQVLKPKSQERLGGAAAQKLYTSIYSSWRLYTHTHTHIVPIKKNNFVHSLRGIFILSGEVGRGRGGGWSCARAFTCANQLLKPFAPYILKVNSIKRRDGGVAEPRGDRLQKV